MFYLYGCEYYCVSIPITCDTCSELCYFNWRSLLFSLLSSLFSFLHFRRWFERAAAQNDPEGLYNVGIFHNNGQAGLAQNPDVALQYFHRAADHPNPFPMALHAVGE